ncbi:MAG: hypothetical protein LBQ55_04630, partial [Treponema sp.]|nr:hypothetical protein [Treponema sp.]
AAVNEAKNAGFKLRIQGQARTNRDNANNMVLALPTATGWVSFLDGVVTVNGGIINDSTWAMGGVLDDDVGEGLGGLVKITPVKGLDLGLGTYVISSDGGGNNNSLTRGLDSNMTTAGNAKYAVSVGYTMPDMFKVTAAWRNKNAAASANGIHTAAINRDESSKLVLGARVLAVKNLTAILEAELDNLQNFEEMKAGQRDAWGTVIPSGSSASANYSGKVNLYQSVGYKVEDIGAGDLGVGLRMAQYISMQTEVDNGDNKTGPGLWFNPWVSYTIGNIVPRLDFVYMAGGKIDGSSGTAEGKYYRDGYVASYFAKDWVMTIRPAVIFNVGKAFVEIGDAINIEENHVKKSFGSAGVDSADKKDGRFTNILYVDFKVSF